MKLTRTTGQICMMMAIVALSGTILRAQETPHHKTPFSYEFDLGGMTPVGATSSGPYSSSFLIGGGASLPLGKWFSLDLLSMDFGFGTTNQNQSVNVSDGTTRRTSNYQMMLTSGGHVNLPLGHKLALGLGGGYGGIFQNEYVPDRVINNGVTTTIQSVNCTVCSRNAYEGPYVEARLFGRSDKYSGFGITAKYYEVRDANHAQGSYLLPTAAKVAYSRGEIPIRHLIGFTRAGINADTGIASLSSAGSGLASGISEMPMLEPSIGISSSAHLTV